MSMQQSEAHRERLREIMADGVPPPSPGATKRAATRTARDQRRQQAATRRREEIAEAAALGVAIVTKLTLDSKWTEEEDAVLRALHPHYEQMMTKLPHRSRPAMRTRIKVLGIAPTRKLWTTKETELLQRLWSHATIDELLTALPRWNSEAIANRAQYICLSPRGKQPLVLTGNPLCDEIRDRCRVLGYSMIYLDRIAHSGKYFQASGWKGKMRSGHRLTPMIRAIKALGGELRVEWPD